MPDSSPYTHHIVVMDAERRGNWEHVLGEPRVPVIVPAITLVSLPGIGDQWVYFMDLDYLNPEQRARLVDHLAERFNLPRPEVDRDLEANGCPVLYERTVLFSHGRAAEPRRLRPSGPIDLRRLL